MPSVQAPMSRSLTGRLRRELRLVSLGLVALMGACLLLLASVFTDTATLAASTRTSVAKYGISFELPKNWTAVSLTPGDIGGLLGSASKVNAKLKSFVASQAASAAKKGLKFFAVNPGGSATVNIGIFGGSGTLPELDATAKLGMSSIGATNVQTKAVHFKFGSAIRVTYALAVTGSATTVYGTQFYASHNAKSYITTFSSQNRAQEEAAASFMMPTWRFSS